MRSKTAKQIQVSAVIATLNRIPYLINTLRDCLKQRGVSKEIIVVDQTPRENWDEKQLRWVKKKCRYFFQKKKGVSEARNVGIRKARGEIILFLDDDVRVSSCLFQAHYKSYDNEDIVGVLGLILDNDYKNKKKGIRIWEKRLGIQKKTNTKTKYITWAPSGNTSYTKKVLKKIKGFDKNLKVYCEDADLSRRVIAGGKKIRFNSTAVIFHLAAPKGGLEHRNDDEVNKIKWLKLRDIAFYSIKHKKQIGFTGILFQIWRSGRMYLLNKKMDIIKKENTLKFLKAWIEAIRLSFKKELTTNHSLD